MLKRSLIKQALSFLFLMLLAPAIASAQLKVVATTEDLGSLASEIGGDKVSVTSLAKGYQDPHFVDPKPSFILAVSRADLLIVVGRELEIGWLSPLLTSSRNSKIQPGSKGYLDASLTVKILEIPTGQITRAMGDVHPLGNPHYWLDPENARPITERIRGALARLSPGDAALFEANRARLLRDLDAGLARWRSALAPYQGTRVVVAHESWPYFARRFGLTVVAALEPTPGVPPSAAHLATLTERMKASRVPLIIAEPSTSASLIAQVTSRAGARAVVLIPSVAGAPEARDYLSLFDVNVARLAAALAAR
jgi:ABC-type Zn uptake system ZnuABC Zn-binding protein ZnuA